MGRGIGSLFFGVAKVTWGERLTHWERSAFLTGVTGGACRADGLGLSESTKSSRCWYESKSCAESGADLVSGMSENDPEEESKDSSEDDKEDSDPPNKELKDSVDPLEGAVGRGWWSS